MKRTGNRRKKYVKSFPKVDIPVFLAPMAGVTNAAFRVLCKRMGAGICYTEFLSSDAIVKYKKEIDQGVINPIFDVQEEERPVVTQIFGEDPDKIFEAAKSLVGRTDVIDLNVGCPAPKILACGGGAALLLDLDKLRLILEKLNTLPVPISCKIRIGVSSSRIVALEVAKIAEETGCCAIAIHGRTIKQGYSGEADWSWIKKVKELVSISVIGNGDINSVSDVINRMEETGCDYVMVGRAAMRDPFFFKKVKHYFETGEELADISLCEKMELFFEYKDLLEEYGLLSFNLLKSAFIQFTKGYRGGKKLRGELSKIKNQEELLNLAEFLVSKEKLF